MAENRLDSARAPQDATGTETPPTRGGTSRRPNIVTPNDLVACHIHNQPSERPDLSRDQPTTKTDNPSTAEEWTTRNAADKTDRTCGNNCQYWNKNQNEKILSVLI